MFQFKPPLIGTVVCILCLACLHQMAGAQQKGANGKSKSKAAVAKAAILMPLAVDSGINIGYIRLKKPNLTGAISVVSDRRFKELAAVSVDALLQGQVAGMQVTNISGAPGAGALINIRGAATLNGGSMPLYIVDGIPVKTYRFINAISQECR